MKKMKILHIASITNPRGNGVAVAVGNYYEYEGQLASVAVYNLESDIISGKFSYNASKYKTISSLPDGFDAPDLVIFNEVYKPAYLTLYRECLRRNIPYIVIPHGCLTKKSQKKNRLKKTIANKLLFNKFIYKSLSIQYLNANEKKESVIKDHKYIISGNGVDIQKKRNKCGNKNLVYIGRYSIRTKGLDLLVDTVAAHRKWFLDNGVRICLYGRDSGNDYAKLKAMILDNNVDDVISLGDSVYGDEKKKILLSACAFVQPSRWEGEPIGVLEALSYGLPCIVTYNTTLGKYINENHCGIGVDFNREKLFEAIKKMFEDEKFRNACAKNTVVVERDYDWGRVIKKCLAEYTNLLDKLRKSKNNLVHCDYARDLTELSNE